MGRGSAASTMGAPWPISCNCCRTSDPGIRLRRCRRWNLIDDAAAVDPVVRTSDRADAQANGVLPLAKQLGRNPREVAADVVAAAEAALDDVATVEVAGPGFLNVTVTEAFLASLAGEMAADSRLGIAGRPGTRIVIDYSHPNVAKEMHIGHLRTTVIGDALARMLTFLGHDVVRENHIGDWGRPFGMLIEQLVDYRPTWFARRPGARRLR